MIRVLIQRTPKDKRLTKVTCHGCESELEYTPKIDAVMTPGIGGVWYRITCPVCKQVIHDEI